MGTWKTLLLVIALVSLTTHADDSSEEEFSSNESEEEFNPERSDPGVWSQNDMHGYVYWTYPPKTGMGQM